MEEVEIDVLVALGMARMPGGGGGRGGGGGGAGGGADMIPASLTGEAS